MGYVVRTSPGSGQNGAFTDGLVLPFNESQHHRYLHLAQGRRTGPYAPAVAMDDLSHNRLVTARADIPRRTDTDATVPYRQNKHVLFGQQEGRCNGYRSEFPFRVLEVDHVIPAGVVVRTTSRTCSCCAPTATSSGATDRRNTWWPGCGSWGSHREG